MNSAETRLGNFKIAGMVAIGMPKNYASLTFVICNQIYYLNIMPVKRKIPFDNGHFFITFTCYNWLHLIDLTDGYDLVYNWFNILKAQGHYITGFVIMPNHVHTTIAFRKTTKGINTIIGDGKRFIGYSIIDRLKKSGYRDVLEQLGNAVNLSDKKEVSYMKYGKTVLTGRNVSVMNSHGRNWTICMRTHVQVNGG
jgi:hypothetical protein